ncbi:TetR/AcrR family transcriptional regulator [Humisphaera borealis]|uniref:TetR/AcrR family transcriptional regulator n=1 Tax=Humisphaera borealis TaxID=2807512 RepID=A0A7M2WXB7_9BACT|nr:TetR/AcrR family transcriptional regulator [Humisphaera borealis]QOV90043.1 TetR/AcrR family transcriptional regulator [Humisphaera borealis]
MPPTAARSEARQRVLETADRLFYQDGVRAVGIDRIIAEAGVAKMSLYKHFASKDDLILAALKHREALVEAFLRSAMERHGRRTKDKLRAFFAALKDWFGSPGFRGCAFINAAAELADPKHPGSQFARDHKVRFRSLLESLIADAVGKDAAKSAPAVALLVDGAIVSAYMQGESESADIARDAALRLMNSTHT